MTPHNQEDKRLPPKGGFDFGTRRGSNTSSHSKKSYLDKPMPGPPAPTMQQIEVVRYTWERICERRHPHDDASVSAAHAFGLCFYEALFLLEPALKSRFANVLQQARAMAGIVAFLTRSPSVKGLAGSIRDINAINKKQHRLFRKGGVPMRRSSGTKDDDPDIADDDDNESFVSLVQSACGKKRNTVCPFHAAATPPIDPPAPADPQQQHIVPTQRSQPLVLKKHVDADVLLKQHQEHEEENLWYADKLQELGATHVDYDVQPQHLDLAGPALLSALRRRLQEECLPEVEDAWDQVLMFSCHYMKLGMQSQYAKKMRKDYRMSAMSTDSLELGETRGQCAIQ
ncbi:hypothetical protein DM01DRAFT_1339491 [Hesseltinella vesiculosa]|uniref:Uncharacterized protein n=1 Tax=Hesseltinella vesiculosa TaxID=101127 RepID=A0A1X2G6N0_9FUNG|nr:hypothetical protein DM01DRAFT_1339491 [Hesseltinella vesiculosa]